MKIHKVSFMICVFLVVLLVGTLGCTVTIGYVGTNVGNKITGTYQLFNGTKTEAIDVDAGKTLIIYYTSEVKKGDLTIKLFDSEIRLLADLDTNVSGMASIIVTKTEEYTLEIAGRNTEGNFDVSWRTE
jgi:hypothetical protein